MANRSSKKRQVRSQVLRFGESKKYFVVRDVWFYYVRKQISLGTTNTGKHCPRMQQLATDMKSCSYTTLHICCNVYILKYCCIPWNGCDNASQHHGATCRQFFNHDAKTSWCIFFIFMQNFLQILSRLSWFAIVLSYFLQNVLRLLLATRRPKPERSFIDEPLHRIAVALNKNL